MEKNKMSEEGFELFFRKKPSMMLVALKRVSRARYGSVLAKEVDCTYSHAVKILQVLEKMGLIIFEKKGRIKIIKLTKKGYEVAEHIEAIKNIIE
ncbi:MAG: winged helix DNA-binding protein [Candidatus Pacearchaeota archaeon]